MGKNTHSMAYNQGLSASLVHITWKWSLRIIHMVSSLSSISFRCNLQQSQILPWIFHSDAPFRCLIFPSPSLLRVMLATMDLVLSSFKMNIPWNSPVNPFLNNLSTSTYEKEMMTILHAVQKWQPYLLGNPCCIKTNHQSLKYFLEQWVSSPTQ